MLEIDRELLKKNNVYDEIIFEEGKAKLVRRIGLTEYHKTYILPKEVVTDLGIVEIQLFKGENYIYIKDEQNNPICAQYIVENEFTDLYATKREVNSSIEQKADEINLQVSEKYVGNDEIIAKINISPEEIKLQANKISFEGLVTANGNFKILEDGSIEAKNGKFIGDVLLGEGKKVIGGDGIMTNLQFKATNEDTWLGYMSDDESQVVNKTKLLIYANIPDNFKITSAKVTLVHTPIIWGTTGADFYGYCRNLKLYKVYNATQKYYLTAFGGWTFSNDSTSESEITNAFGTNGFTPTVPTSSNFKAETKISIDLTNQLQKGINLLRVHTSNNIAWKLDDFEPYKQSGMCEAYLDVIGYMST